MRVLGGRRPEVLLLASLLVFAAVLALRVAQGRSDAPVAVDMAAPAPRPAELGDEATVAQLQERIRANPDDTAAYALLGLALLQQVRETADPGLYARAEAALDAAIERDPRQFDALVGQGQLALALHRFEDALAWGERAHAANPLSARPYGITGDALVELGRYQEAVAAVQKMVDTRPDQASYSRVAYLRELHGDTEGAIRAMEQAAEAGGADSEGTLWVLVQLGNLHFGRGDLAAAREHYAQAEGLRPGYAHAQAGLARVLAAQGRHDEAAEIYTALVARLPLPEFVIALGELHEADGRPEAARRQYDLVRAMQQLNAGAGMDVDMELALFEADHGDDPAAAVAQARAAYQRRPSIHAADALAWALHRAGDSAQASRYSEEALRLGTRDAALLYRAGMIARADGDADAARDLLGRALATNPHFSPLHAPEARRALSDFSTVTSCGPVPAVRRQCGGESM